MTVTDLSPCCRMDSPEGLYESGIFINDLAMYDSSRDIILAGSQKDPELKIALSQVSQLSTLFQVGVVMTSSWFSPCRRRSVAPSWRRASSRPIISSSK